MIKGDLLNEINELTATVQFNADLLGEPYNPQTIESKISICMSMIRDLFMLVSVINEDLENHVKNLPISKEAKMAVTSLKESTRVLSSMIPGNPPNFKEIIGEFNKSVNDIVNTKYRKSSI